MGTQGDTTNAIIIIDSTFVSRFHNASIRESWKRSDALSHFLRTMAFNEFPLQRVWRALSGSSWQVGKERRSEKKKKKLREVTFDQRSVKMVSADFVKLRAVTRVLCIRRYLWLDSGRERNRERGKKRRQERVTRGGVHFASGAAGSISRSLSPSCPDVAIGGVAILAKISIENGNPRGIKSRMLSRLPEATCTCLLFLMPILSFFRVRNSFLKSLFL